MGGYEGTVQAEVVEGKELAYPNIALGCPWRSAVLTIILVEYIMIENMAHLCIYYE